MFYLHVYECSPHTFPQRTEKAIRCPTIRIRAGCEFPCEYWELNTGLLKEEVLLTDKSSLQLLVFNFQV